MPAESVVIRRRTRPVHVDGFITVNSQEAKDAPDGSKDWRQVRRPAAYSAESKNAWIQISKYAAELLFALIIAPIFMMMVYQSFYSVPQPFREDRVLELKKNVTSAMLRYGICSEYGNEDDAVHPLPWSSKTTLLQPTEVLLVIHEGEKRRAAVVKDTWASAVSSSMKKFYFGAPLDQSQLQHNRPKRSRAYVEGSYADFDETLSALKQAYMANPAQKWYVKVDDQTYVHTDRLLQLLRGFDPSLNYYLGSAMFALNKHDPDGLFSFKFAFGHGGAGYILSNSAIRALVSSSPETLLNSNAEKAMDCGRHEDVCLGYMLHQLGISLTAIEGLHAFDPQLVESFAMSPDVLGVRSQLVYVPLPHICPPITFYHIDTLHMYRLFEADQVAVVALQQPSWELRKWIARYGDLHADLLRDAKLTGRIKKNEQQNQELYDRQYVVYDLAYLAGGITAAQWLEGLYVTLLFALLSDRCLLVTPVVFSDAISASLTVSDLFHSDHFHLFTEAKYLYKVYATVPEAQQLDVQIQSSDVKASLQFSSFAEAFPFQMLKITTPPSIYLLTAMAGNKHYKQRLEQLMTSVSSSHVTASASSSSTTLLVTALLKNMLFPYQELEYFRSYQYDAEKN